MKTYQNYSKIIPLCFAVINIMFSACNSPQSGDKNQNAEFQSDSLTEHKKAAMAYPFIASKYNVVKASGSSAYSIKDAHENYIIPNIVNPLINSRAFTNYFNRLNVGNQFNGILFYPGLKNNALHLIMCAAFYNQADSTISRNAGYVSLEKGFYLGDTSVNPDIASTAGTDHEKYTKDVLIKRAKQIPSGANNDTIRTSRFYYWRDFERLMTQNNPANSYIQFDIGYADQEVVNNYPAWLLDNFSVPQQQGFTVLCHIKDEQGKSMMDPFAVYEENIDTARINYINRGLEVGVPCPPRCGTLY